MIRFVYPNVNASEQFVGCGRYLTTTPDDPCLTHGYFIARPNLGYLSNVTTAASLLAKESFDADREVYEYQDDPTAPYIGDSMGLAYLLALIYRSRTTIWEKNGRSLDIWCTGAIEVVAGMPMLHNVYRNLFAIKLQAFLDEQDAPLFIVPVANIEPQHRQLFRQQHVTVRSLDQGFMPPIQEIVDRKTILQVHGDELAILMDAIFEQPSPLVVEAVPKTAYLSTATEEEFGGGSELSSTGFLIFGLLTFWIYTVLRYHKILQTHIQTRLGYFKSLSPLSTLTPEQQQTYQTLIKRGFTPKEHPKYLSMSLYLLSMLCILACFVLNAFGVWAGQSTVADLVPEEIAKTLNVLGPRFLFFLDKAIFLIVGGAAFFFCVSSVYFLSWVCRTTRDHEYYELLLAKLISNPEHFKMVGPSETFVRRWNANQNWIALFLILSIPMIFSPLMVVKYTLDSGTYAGWWLFFWTLIVFLCGAIFHFWGTQILIGMYNGHLQVETVNQHWSKTDRITPSEP
jgi:hypothetical protein